MYGFIGTLSESRLFSSTAALKRYSAEELAELAVLYVCTLYVLFSYKDTKHFAETYAKRTTQQGSFTRWSNSATDLYVILYGLRADNVQLDDQDTSDRFKSVMPFGEALLDRWLTELQRGNVREYTHRALFTRMDFNFKIGNSSIRAVRRLVMDWDGLDAHEKKLAATRLIQLLRYRAAGGELYRSLLSVAGEHDLVIHGACDADTGECPSTATDKSKKKGHSFMAVLAGVAAGVAVANAIDSNRKK